ncbi:MAG: aldehyde dehydrogenase family protein, partial [Treponema sp.]|nr:aldehyde dehydrogenase family protein [Treponema sp.]
MTMGELSLHYAGPILHASDLEAAVAAARTAQEGWAALPYGERARRLKKAGRFMGERIDALTGVIQQDTGKLPLDALSAEIVPAFMALDYYLRRGRRFLASRPTGAGSPLMFNKRGRMIFRPYGVVGIISPWNYPFAIPFSEAVMALLAGNAVILKTASDTPGSGRALAAIFAAAELPPSLFAYAEIPGREAGPALIASGIDKLFFTGSTGTGRSLMALAAPRLLPLVLELGGADAAVVCADADLDRAASGLIWAAYANAGQSCGGAQRILIHQAVYSAFAERFTARVRALRPGIDLGPMASLRQKAAVERQIAGCLAQGAVIAAQSPGAGAMEGAERFVPAIALTQVNSSMPVMADELFGPVAALIPFADDEAAVRMANASPYGLTGSVWSRSRAHAKALAGRINAGAVMINDHLMSHGLAETPWGGFGDS